MNDRKSSRLVWGAILGCMSLVIACGCVVVGGVFLRSALTDVERGPYTLRVINETGELLCSLNIKAASSQTYFGADRLQGDVLEPGDSFTIAGLAEGYYDIRAGQCANSVVQYGRNDVPVLAKDSEWILRQ